MKRKAFFKKILRFQHADGWCGPVVVQMALAAGGIRKSQKVIAQDISHQWFGTTQQSIFAYLSLYFSRVNFKENSTLTNVAYHLNKKHIVIVNWFDDTPEGNTPGVQVGEYDYGHYSLLIDYNKEKKEVTLLDPSEGLGFRKMKAKDFKDRWYDYLDSRGQHCIVNWMLWVDTTSRVKPAGNVLKHS